MTSTKRAGTQVREEERIHAVRMIRQWWMDLNKTGNELTALILEETGVTIRPVDDDEIGARLTDDQIQRVASRCRQELISAGIKGAIDAIAVIPFNSWPNRELRGVAIAILEASARDYNDPRQLPELCAALNELGRHVATSADRNLRDQRSIAERLTMVATGRTETLDDADYRKSAWDSILEIERRREVDHCEGRP